MQVLSARHEANLGEGTAQVVVRTNSAEEAATRNTQAPFAQTDRRQNCLSDDNLSNRLSYFHAEKPSFKPQSNLRSRKQNALDNSAIPIQNKEDALRREIQANRNVFSAGLMPNRLKLLKQSRQNLNQKEKDLAPAKSTGRSRERYSVQRICRNRLLSPDIARTHSQEDEIAQRHDKDGNLETKEATKDTLNANDKQVQEMHP